MTSNFDLENQLTVWFNDTGIFYKNIELEVYHKTFQKYFLIEDHKNILQLTITGISFIDNLALLSNNGLINYLKYNINQQTVFKKISIEDNSIDIIIAPHLFELNNHYELILEDCVRILKPQGLFILSGFNYYSYFNFKRPKLLQELTIIKNNLIQTKFHDVGFNILEGVFFNYSKRKWLTTIMKRWFAVHGNNYLYVLKRF